MIHQIPHDRMTDDEYAGRCVTDAKTAEEMLLEYIHDIDVWSVSETHNILILSHTANIDYYWIASIQYLLLWVHSE